MRLILILCVISLNICQKKDNNLANQHKSNITSRINGLSFVAPPAPFHSNPMQTVKNINSNWIAVIPYGYSPIGKAVVHYNSSRQWWGERLEGVEATIKLAKEHGLKVMLKPQVYVPRSWTGAIDFEQQKEWEEWEQQYEEYILEFVKIAAKFKVEMFCIGTEFKISEQKRAKFWINLIKKIRKQYKGSLTYAANWDAFEEVTFWDKLDYVGINAYFPLTSQMEPTTKDIIKAWQPHLEKIRSFQQKNKKPILFTEYGYLSVAGCTYNNWELEKKIQKLWVDENAQADALEALYTIFYKEDYWKGGFLWKWFPEMKGHEGYPEKDYTPQGKEGEQVVKKWFTQ